MGQTLHCPEWEEKLSLYVDGVLNPFNENAVVAHLSRCAACRATVELWQAVGQSVRRLPRELPPPQLRERILAATTRRRRQVRRWFVPVRVLAPALGVGLLLGWLTLPRPEPARELAGQMPTPRVQETVFAPVAPPAQPPGLPSAPLVIVLQATPSYRTVSPAPRWLASTRLSPAPIAHEPQPVIVATSESPPRFAPALSAPPALVTEIAESSELPTTGAEMIGISAPTATTTTAAQNLAERLRQLNQQLREEDRRQITGAAQRESDRRRFFVPIVTVDLK